jgi:hypothetical protein
MCVIEHAFVIKIYMCSCLLMMDERRGALLYPDTEVKSFCHIPLM